MKRNSGLARTDFGCIRKEEETGLHYQSDILPPAHRLSGHCSFQKARASLWCPTLCGQDGKGPPSGDRAGVLHKLCWSIPEGLVALAPNRS